jgi:hypothetical protein
MLDAVQYDVAPDSFWVRLRGRSAIFRSLISPYSELCFVIVAARSSTVQPQRTFRALVSFSNGSDNAVDYRQVNLNPTCPSLIGRQ